MLLLFWGTVFLLGWRTFASQWDFWVYFDGVHAWRAGLNPYVAESLQNLPTRFAKFDFTYPPLSLLFFAPLTFLPAKLAAVFWLSLKAVLLVLVYTDITRRFSLPRYDWRLIALALFSFNSALVWDLASGNIAILQMAALYAACVGFLQQRYVLFAVLIAVVAQFKLFPLLFLYPLLFVSPLPWIALGTGVLLFAALFAFNSFFSMQLLEWFWFAAKQRAAEGSILEPSLKSFFIALAETMQSVTSLPFSFSASSEVGLYLYVFAAALILLTSVYQIKKYKLQEQQLLAYAFLTVLLILPRLKSYTFVLALPFVFLYFDAIKARPGLLLFLLFPYLAEVGIPQVDITGNPHFGPIKKILRVGYEYLPFWQLFAVWLVSLPGKHANEDAATGRQREPA